MFEWIVALFTALFSWVLPHADTTPKTDYIAVAASEAAYSALLPESAPVKPKVLTKDCTKCNGRGEVPTGDPNHPWTKCPDCEGPPRGTDTSQAPAPPVPAAPPPFVRPTRPPISR